MRADTLYAVEVMPNNVKYYGVEHVGFPNDEEAIVSIPLAQLKELMEFASETHSFTRSMSIYDLKVNELGDIDDEDMQNLFDTIDTVLEKTRGCKFS